MTFLLVRTPSLNPRLLTEYDMGRYKIILHVFSRPEGYGLTRSILAAHSKMISCHTKHTGVNLLDLMGFLIEYHDSLSNHV